MKAQGTTGRPICLFFISTTIVASLLLLSLLFFSRFIDVDGSKCMG